MSRLPRCIAQSRSEHSKVSSFVNLNERIRAKNVCRFGTMIVRTSLALLTGTVGVQVVSTCVTWERHGAEPCGNLPDFVLSHPYS
jgi:hypothetical protein